MVRFQCEGKRVVRKTVFFGFCVKMSSFFAKNLGMRYVILSFTYRLSNEGIVFFDSL